VRRRPPRRLTPSPSCLLTQGLLVQWWACASVHPARIAHGVLALRRAFLQSCLSQPACGGERVPDACCVAAAFGLYAFLGFLMDGPASLATGMIGLQIAPQCAPAVLGVAHTQRCWRAWAAGRCSREWSGRRLHMLVAVLYRPGSVATCVQALAVSRHGWILLCERAASCMVGILHASAAVAPVTLSCSI
jgi:hypothetical protein